MNKFIRYVGLFLCCMKASVQLPESVSGRFLWNGREYPLHGGTQTVDAE